MITRGFRPVAWVAAIGAAALCCYMLSLQVAAERSELASIEARILDTKQDIRSLQTELGTRSRLQQLEQWNADVLALSAPVASQFLDSNVSLARFDINRPTFSDQPVRLASAEQAEPATPVSAATPSIRLASTAPGAPTAGPAPAAVGAPLVRRASLVVVPAVSPVAEPVRARRASALLDEATIRDLGSEARSETGSDSD